MPIERRIKPGETTYQPFNTLSTPGLEDNQVINHPPHYNNSLAHCTCGRRIECIDITRHQNFNIGNAFKYLWRADLKGTDLTDLKKAAWYIQDEIAKRERVDK